MERFLAAHLEFGQVSLQHVLVEDGASCLRKLSVPLPRPALKTLNIRTEISILKKRTPSKIQFQEVFYLCNFSI